MPPEQEPLVSGAGGLWRRYLTGNQIDHPAWLRARAEHAPVGTCRRCNANLHPETPHDRGGGRLDYTAVCAGCGYTLSAPGGRVVRGDTTAWSKSGGAGRVAALTRAAKEAG